MSRLLPVHLTLERQGYIALIAVVAIGYFMTFLAALSQETFPLSPLWRWPVYLALLSGVAVPLGFRYQNWEDAFYFTLTFSPAILFVVVFTQNRQFIDPSFFLYPPPGNSDLKYGVKK